MPNEFFLGISFQNALIVLCQHMGFLMPQCCLSFAFFHLHGRFDVLLRRIPSSMLFRIGLMIQVRLDLLRLERSADILGPLL